MLSFTVPTAVENACERPIAANIPLIPGDSGFERPSAYCRRFSRVLAAPSNAVFVPRRKESFSRARRTPVSLYAPAIPSKLFVADFSASPNAAPACRENVFARRLEQSASQPHTCLFQASNRRTKTTALLLVHYPPYWLRNILSKSFARFPHQALISAGRTGGPTVPGVFSVAVCVIRRHPESSNICKPVSKV